MARRKTKKKFNLFGFLFAREKTSRSTVSFTRKIGFDGLAQVFAFISVVAAGAGILYIADDYVKSIMPIVSGELILLDMPGWVSPQLERKVKSYAGGDQIELSDRTAKIVAENLLLVPWLKDIRVLTTDHDVRVLANWRKPLAYIRRGQQFLYLDYDLVTLEYVSLPALNIIEIVGDRLPSFPVVGSQLNDEDLAAAILLIWLLDDLDRKLVPNDPLLAEIQHIDIDNFRGRKNNRNPHILFKCIDGTEIEWGAAPGEWARFLEANDEDKFAKLYSYYRQTGTLLGQSKNIKLNEPQDGIIQPIDRRY